MNKRICFFLSLAFLCGTITCCQAQPLPAVIRIPNDSATIAASTHYKNPSFFKRLFLGKNYRTAWATPVTLPVFHLKQQGFTIKELGGGQQTKSLHLLDGAGHAWALRSIDKDVQKALPSFLQHTLAQKITQDMVSAAHPFAPLTIPILAQATGVVVAVPAYFFVPDDTVFGAYNKYFKNTMCLLEAREPTPDNSKTENTAEVVTALLKSTAVRIDAEAVLRARLLDMLIGDWDRHQDQWRWGFKKVGGVDYGYAIPRDRDQAFFYSKGLLVKLARMVAAKHLVGFAKNTSKVKKLNAKSWNFDRMFLVRLDVNDWNRIIQAFTAALPDSILHAAVKKLPPQVYPLHGALLEKKLISRRNGLLKDALRYQRFLASYITIVGTDERDRFVFISAKNSLTIQQYAGADFSKLVFTRTFHRSDTYQVNIVGLDGADEFIERSDKASRIRLKLDGGKGSNEYRIKKNRRIKIFDSAMNAASYYEVVKKALKIKD